MPPPTASRGLFRVVAGLLLGLLACGDTPEAPAADGDTLRVIVPREILSLDPRFITDAYGLKVSRLIYASLFTIDSRSLQIVPDLAESYEFIDDRTLSVTLRRDARFSDGSILDASDVIATFQGVANPDVGSVYAGTFRRFESMERIDRWTVRLRLREPHATVLSDLEFPILREEDAHLPAATRTAFAGSGPYMLRSWNHNRVVLERQPHWRGQREGVSPPDRLEFLLVRDDNSRALRLQAAGADLAVGGVSPLLLPMFEGPDFRIESAPGIGTAYLGFHTERVSKPLRRAIAHAVDAELLLRAELGGRGELASSWIPKGHWADAGLSRPGLDRALARELVAQEGARGRRLILRTSTDRARLSICRAVAAMLRDIGLDVEVRPSENATLIADLNAGRFDLTFLEVPEVFEPHVLHWFFASDRIPQQGSPGANRWRLRDAETDAALERGRSTMELANRREAYRRVQERLAEELPVLPLWHPHNVAVMRRGVEFEVPRDGRLSTLFR